MRMVRPTRLERLQQFLQLLTRAVVVLGDGELQCVFEGRLGFRGPAKGNQ